jgi:hypothetical protein
MAVEEKANVAYVEQLREMRAQRMMQLRQGNDQKQQFSLMTRALNSVAAATNTQTRVATQNLREQQAVVRQTRELSKDFRALSSSITRSIGGLTAAIGRGIGGTASLAGRGVAATAGTAVNLTSSIMSVLGRVLPVALVGIVGKAFVWDNLSTDTKDKLTNALGKLFTNIFSTLKPVFAKLGETIKSVFEDIGIELSATMAGIKAVMSKSMGDLSTSLSTSLAPLRKSFEGIEEFVGTAGRFKEKITPNFDMGNISVGDVVTASGAVLAGKGLYDLARGGTTPKGISGPVIVVTDDIKKAYSLLAQNKMSPTPGNIVGARIIVEAEKAGGSAAKNFLRFVYDYKIANILGVVVPAAMYLWGVSEIEEILSKMERENLITPEEKQYFLSSGKTISATSAASSVLLSTLAMYATRGMGGGKVSTMVSGGLGGTVGAKFGEYVGRPLHEIGEFLGITPKRPASLDRQTVTGTSTVEEMRRLTDERRSSVPQPYTNSVMPNGPTGSNTFDMNTYRNMIGIHEAGATAYDAMFGVHSEADVKKYMAEKTNNKRLTEMTIGEAIALQKSMAGTNRQAMGRYQFMDVEKAAYLAGLSHKERMSPENQDKMFAAYTKANADRLKDLGITPTAFTLRLAHAVGPDGAKLLLDANKSTPGALPADVLGLPMYDKQGKIHPQRLTNPQLAGLGKYKGQTVSSYLATMNEKVVNAMGPNANANLGDYSFGSSSLSDYQSVFEQAYSGYRDRAYAERDARRNQGKEAEGSKMKFFNSGMVEGLVGAFKDGSELKSNIVSDLRNMANMLGGPATKPEEQAQKNIVTNFNTTNINNNNIGGGGGGVSTNGVRAKDDLVTDFLKMSGT